MRRSAIFVVAALGLLAGLGAVWYFGEKHPPQPPVFHPASDPYAQGIYATGIVESDQGSGENIPMYPEVAGTVVAVLVKEGQAVHAGDRLLQLDTSIQQQIVAQQKSQANAARALLQELRAQPRPEALAVATAQVEAATAQLRLVQDQYSKLQRAVELDPRAVSRDSLDNAANAVRTADANLAVARRQFELVRAGAWRYDIENQERTAEALENQSHASEATLRKFTLVAPSDGTVLSVNAAIGSYVSPQGIIGTYTQGPEPVIVMSGPQQKLAVRAYIDEILLQRLPPPDRIIAQMNLRGTDTKVPLQFVRVQPYVSPKIELSDQRKERVDLRVLPVVFRFMRPPNTVVYPGQQVDIYIGTKGGG